MVTVFFGVVDVEPVGGLGQFALLCAKRYLESSLCWVCPECINQSVNKDIRLLITL